MFIIYTYFKQGNIVMKKLLVILATLSLTACGNNSDFVVMQGLIASGVMHTTYDAAQEHAQTLRRLYQEMVAF